jgi:hypothetical protein
MKKIRHGAMEKTKIEDGRWRIEDCEHLAVDA